jgi:hypothetical protein
LGQLSDATGKVDPPLERLSFYGILAGLTALVPVPFVDDWTFNLVRRRLGGELFARHGILLSRPARTALGSKEPWAASGCLYQAFFLLVLLPVKILAYFFRRLAQTLLFFLALKQATDRASETFHEGYLVDAALRRGVVPAAPEPEVIEALVGTIRQTIAQVDTSPIRSIFRRVLTLNRTSLSQAASVLGQLAKRKRKSGLDEESSFGLEAEERILSRLITAAADLLSGELGYLRSLEERFSSSGRPAPDEWKLGASALSRSRPPGRGSRNEGLERSFLPALRSQG